MKETITIKNFGGLKDAVIPLNSINIFIGKQASGKSVTAKLIYFFRKIFEDIFDGLIDNKNLKEINEIIEKRFKNYFPVDTWTKANFKIEYKLGDRNKFLVDDRLVYDNSNKSIIVEGNKNGRLTINYKEIIRGLEFFQRTFIEAFKKERFHEFMQPQPSDDENIKILGLIASSNPNLMAKLTFQIIAGSGIQSFCPQMFIPAGRAYFANIQSSVFSILARGESIDPFVIEFGTFYEIYRKVALEADDKNGELITKFIETILGAEYYVDKSGEYLVHKDKRKVPLLYCSSGQQEVLPLVLLMKYLRAVLENNAAFSIYIEEPEAHLFPSSQKTVVEMISHIHNLSKDKSQLFITTHSPYILTAFNNLLQAGYLLEQGADKEKLFKIVPEFEVLKCGELNAYAFQDGGVVSLIDEETGLISADMLDQVSEEIAIQFDELLELENA
ncbi:MAG: ATP-binding protein [Pyrinomonadaceae bacterium]|nr:ATP-binding protein [Pyrinomonadaceae bacterium]